jgi:hypothetical protein
VHVVRSSDPAVDGSIPSAVRRWRYQPWLEDGRAVPFCYSLHSQIAAR